MSKRILVVHDGKVKGHGLDLVISQEVLALSEAGYEIDFLSRGTLDYPGVTNLTHRYSWANLISWIGRRKYHDAKRRAFANLGKSRLKTNNYNAVISWLGGSRSLVREAEKQKVPLFLNVALLTGQPYDRFATGNRHKPSLWPRVSQAERRSEYQEKPTHLLLTSAIHQRVFTEAGVPSEQLHLIERGYDSDKFFPAERPMEKFRLLFCGKVSQRKGVMEALEAWREANLDNAEFWIVGRIAPDHEKQYRKAAKDNVHFLGYQADPGTLMRQCHVQILLSLAEGQAKSLIEGAACGLVTIATSATGFPFQRGELGFEVDSKDISRVAEILGNLADQHKTWQKISEKAAGVMRDHYQWKAFRQRLVREMETAL